MPAATAGSMMATPAIRTRPQIQTKRAVAEMAVPAVEIEIGEQEDDEASRRAPTSVPARHICSLPGEISMILLRKPKSTQI